jgi:hypothetical protein
LALPPWLLRCHGRFQCPEQSYKVRRFPPLLYSLSFASWPRLGVCGWSVTDASAPLWAGHRLLPPFCDHPLPQRSAMCRVYCWRTRGLYPEPEGHSLAVPLSGCWWNLKATAQLSFCPPPSSAHHVLPYVCDLPLAGYKLVSGPSDSVWVHCWVFVHTRSPHVY